MRQQDIGELLEIEVRAYSSPWSEVNFRDALCSGYAGWIVLQDDQIVAYTVLLHTPEGVEILNLCVDPDFQGNGLGGRLLSHIVSLANKNRAEKILLDVRASNVVAISLYKKFDFKKVGIRKNYYRDKTGKEDAILMTVELDR